MIPNRKRWRKHTVTIDSMTIKKFSVKFLGGKRNAEFFLFFWLVDLNILALKEHYTEFLFIYYG
jgi:hypothetical protein